jgi:hypothetical protein
MALGLTDLVFNMREWDQGSGKQRSQSSLNTQNRHPIQRLFKLRNRSVFT